MYWLYLIGWTVDTGSMSSTTQSRAPSLISFEVTAFAELYPCCCHFKAVSPTSFSSVSCHLLSLQVLLHLWSRALRSRQTLITLAQFVLCIVPLWCCCCSFHVSTSMTQWLLSVIFASWATRALTHVQDWIPSTTGHLLSKELRGNCITKWVSPARKKTQFDDVDWKSEQDIIKRSE